MLPLSLQIYLAVPNVTAHLSTASVPMIVLLYDGPLLCGFNEAIKGLNGVDNDASAEPPNLSSASYDLDPKRRLFHALAA